MAKEIDKLKQFKKVFKVDALKLIAILDVNQELNIPLYAIINNEVKEIYSSWLEMKSTLYSLEVQFKYDNFMLLDYNFYEFDKVFLSKEEALKKLERKKEKSK